MTLQEIKSAVLAGQKVQWLVICRETGGCWGLTWADKTTMNGKPWDFFVG